VVAIKEDARKPLDIYSLPGKLLESDDSKEPWGRGRGGNTSLSDINLDASDLTEDGSSLS
jgi:hypothetical protein